MKILHIDDVRPGRPEGVDWLPLRAELGVTAFGVSAYRADAGETVVPRHAEAEGGGAGVHEELYVVLAGRATFTVDDETFDAPPGTWCSRCPESGERRARRSPGP
jgi:mannose-6-phosphate isomerase-like protein (cupin superfamily)